MIEEKGPLFVEENDGAPRPDLPFIEREATTALVYDVETKKYLCLRWKKIDWETFVTGGVEDEQTPEEASRAEVNEETGYKNLRLSKILPRYQAKFYHGPKGVNRHAFFHNFLFELVDKEQDDVSDGEKEKHEYIWLNESELEDFHLPDGHRFLLDSIKDNRK